jgi:hypothetical protein
MTREEPRNPFKSEEDAFRILVLVLVAAAVVIASAVLISPALGAVLGAIAVAIGLWRAGGWLAMMLGEPDEDDRPGGRA